jgi:hypothetical protein
LPIPFDAKEHFISYDHSERIAEENSTEADTEEDFSEEEMDASDGNLD